jgi:hypothetical protein
MDIYFRVHWSPGHNRPFILTFNLPIHQRFLMIGSLCFHLAWNESAMLIRRANEKATQIWSD